MTADETREKVARALYEQNAWVEIDDLTCKETFLEIATAAIATYESAQWMTIESAPKDYTAVMVWGSWHPNLSRADRIVIARYDAWDDEDGQWYEVLEARPFWPTHWRPLPPPPATARLTL
jgi:hypothetical protein